MSETDLHQTIRKMGDRALAAARKLANCSTRKKNAILLAMADEIEAQREAITVANREDVEAARKAGLSPAMIDRLTLTEGRMKGMIEGIRTVAGLPDPVGKRLSKTVRPNGLVIEKRRVPIGVIAIIYESRPNVTADAAVLCIKTSNTVILRGGKESIRSNRAIAHALQTGGAKAGLPDNAVQLVETTDREAVRELVQMDDAQAPPMGTHGTVTGVDDTGSLLVDWDNGSGLNVIWGVDVVRKVTLIMTGTIRDQILAIRDTGLTNMFDVPMVQKLAYDRGYYELVTFLEEHRREYAHFIMTGEAE